MSGRCVPEVFAGQAAATPDAVALVDGATRVTYAELDARSASLAHRLVTAGVRVGDVVAVHLERTADLAVSVLAVLRAGAVYTMLDPLLPAQRRESIVRSAGPVAVIGWPVGAVPVVEPSASPPARAAAAPDVALRPEDGACLMFTSGSTGAPKGVLSPHRALVATLTGQDYAGFGPGQVWLQIATVSWDAFATQLLGPLLHGGTCVLYPGHRVDPETAAALVTAHGVTVLDASASLFNHLLDEHPEVFATVRRALSGGEAASPAHMAAARRDHPHVVLVNGYGPVESMGFTTTHVVGDADTGGPVPIGVALRGKGCHVLDDAMRPVPAGVTGELYVSGAGLAHGYLGRPGATAERFVPLPGGAPGERAYRTGDLARWRPDGALDFLGRIDDQVKIRGYRVEPAEAATALVAHPAVAQAAVLAREHRPGELLLVAYVAGAAVPGTRELRRHCRDRLPEYLRPSVYVVLDALPLTPNGKLDRAALPVTGLRPGARPAPASEPS